MPTPTPIKRTQPTITLSYTGIVVRNVSDFDIEEGSKFKLLVDNAPESLSFEDWFFNNDPVLFAEVDKDGKSANIEVRGTGSCVIRIDNVGSVKLNVYPQRAVGFSVGAGKVENK